MALYEFVLRFRDRSDEIRVGDYKAGVGDLLLIAGRRSIVVARVDGNGRTAARFLLDPPTESPSAGSRADAVALDTSSSASPVRNSR